MVTTEGKIEAFRMFNSATKVAKFHIPLGVSGSKEDCDIDDQAIKVAAAIVCDGYRHGNGWSIAVSRPKKVDCLDQLGAHKTRHIRRCAGDKTVAGERVITTKADKVVFGYSDEAHGGLIDNGKNIVLGRLMQFSKRQSRLLVDNLLAFDGSDSGTARRFFNSRLARIAAFELACVIAGLSVSPRKSRRSDIGKDNVIVTVSKKSVAPVVKCDRPGFRVGIFTKEYAGKVWCCRVPTGVIVVRRHGLSMLCGNCAEAAALRGAFPEEIGNEYTNDEVGAVMFDAGQQTIESKPTPPPTTKTSLRTNGHPAPEPTPEVAETEPEVETGEEPQDETELYWSEFSNSFEACLNAGETEGMKNLLDQYRDTFINNDKYARRLRECVAIYEGQVEPPKGKTKK